MSNAAKTHIDVLEVLSDPEKVRSMGDDEPMHRTTNRAVARAIKTRFNMSISVNASRSPTAPFAHFVSAHDETKKWLDQCSNNQVNVSALGCLTVPQWVSVFHHLLRTNSRFAPSERFFAVNMRFCPHTMTLYGTTYDEVDEMWLAMSDFHLSSKATIMGSFPDEQMANDFLIGVMKKSREEKVLEKKTA